ncbi:unnamed protein product [Prunus brigantina]
MLCHSSYKQISLSLVQDHQYACFPRDRRLPFIAEP